MIVINILGGLGNQMFQYAFAYTIAKKKNEVLKLDINDFNIYDLRKFELDLFNIDVIAASKEEVKSLKDKNIFQKLLRKVKKSKTTTSEQYYKEPHFHFDKNVYERQGDVYFEGYWQSEMYFKEFRKELLEIFIFKNKIHPQSIAHQKKILLTQSVSLHIRRGDYVTNHTTNSYHGTCDLEYYQNAVELINKKIKNLYFFIFSDDLKWAKKNINFIENLTFIDLENGIPDYEEMYLMSQCKHNIIANSSFSWWGAWLNQNPDKLVIAPKKWFTNPNINTDDLIPDSWIRL